jgi:endonuclease/exonuclease/phosphatase family metal-dependent hydrolase
MIGSLLTRRRALLGRELREPTLLALGLTAAGLLALLGACVAAVLALPALGGGWWAIAAVAALLCWLAWRRSPQPRALRRLHRRACLLRLLGLGRRLNALVLACWLALLVWAQTSRGGPAPPPKGDDRIRVVTWNIHCGQDSGPPWQRFDWPARKHALRLALEQARPDVLCVQEARPGQVAFLEQALPGHRRVGVGRPDGEHCAIFFAERFEPIDGGTFSVGGQRICTWVRLRDRSGGVFRVYNTHLHLTEGPRRSAARVILAHVAAGDPADAVVLTADFNAPPSAPSRQLFAAAGLADSATRVGAATFQLYGLPLRCLDGILVGPGWRVDNHLILDVKPNNKFPSDHFGVLADLTLPAGPGGAGG